MATKAEQFRYQAERSGPKKSKRPPSPRGRADGTSEAVPHNAAPRAAKHAAYALEVTAGGHATRKSSRKAANRQKTDIQFRLKRKVGEGRPGTRARRTSPRP
jgi:hypothetical protein